MGVCDRRFTTTIENGKTSFTHFLSNKIAIFHWKPTNSTPDTKVLLETVQSGENLFSAKKEEGNLHVRKSSKKN